MQDNITNDLRKLFGLIDELAIMYSDTKDRVKAIESKLHNILSIT